MKKFAITIKSINKPGVLRDITDMMANCGINISYTHLFVEKDYSGSIYLELEDVDNIDELIYAIKNSPAVLGVKVHRSLDEICGKRIIIIGGGAQGAHVALGAINEADRPNIRG
ncbi:MAG: DUF5612 domain-containing protein, partial [Methanobacterium sp.]|nr:DUF5612 domain-containing protein [Methanobacterium sp.]